jgi:hypothetical protein
MSLRKGAVYSDLFSDYLATPLASPVTLDSWTLAGQFGNSWHAERPQPLARFQAKPFFFFILEVYSMIAESVTATVGFIENYVCFACLKVIGYTSADGSEGEENLYSLGAKL